MLMRKKHETLNAVIDSISNNYIVGICMCCCIEVAAIWDNVLAKWWHLSEKFITFQEIIGF